MDWLTLRGTYEAPQGQPARCERLLALGKVLDGTQYDGLPNPFSRERSGAGEYIPLSDRRPAVRTNLCRTVVDEAVSLLFGEAHWPGVSADVPKTAEILADWAVENGLPVVMAKAATRGSVGSVALLLEAHDRRVCVQVLETAYLTPQFSPGGALLEVGERYQVSGADLVALGYDLPKDQGTVKFWYARRWDEQDLTIWQPQRVGDEKPPVIDAGRSMTHGLGFVPIVWVRNLASAGGDEIDGACTFERAIDSVIEADYLLSQGGRALRYASDPTLVISAGANTGGDAARTGGAASALNLPPEGDAKLLEINGKSSAALLDHYRELRALVLEQIHGNRAHADKLAAAQSGRAMELMCQSLIWLAGQLRQSYGAAGLVPLYAMVCRFSGVLEGGIAVGGDDHAGLDPSGIALRWPAWFAPTSAEILQFAQGLVTAVTGGLMSEQTACEIFASRLGIADAAAEWARVQDEIAQKTAEAAAQVRKDANTGTALSRAVEA